MIKITDIEIIHVSVNQVRGNWTFVRVHTDKGISGLGEASNVRDPRGVERAIRRIEPMLAGIDPLNLEAYLQACGQPEHVGFANHITAMSGIETALWDIKGKTLGVPVHVLLGGRIRDRVRLYANINRQTGLQPTPAGFARAAREAIDRGFTAVKFYPFWGLMDGTSIVGGNLRQQVVDEGLARVRAVREAVGPRVDVLLQLPPYDMSFGQMVDLAKALAQFRPFWYQTTFPKVEDNARLVQSTPIPVASPARGTYSLDRGRWRAYLQGVAMDVTNPDLMSVGGLGQMSKIASMAETWGVGFSPHSPYGPVHAMADVHLCATLPNFIILEYSIGEAPWRGTVITPHEEIVDGYAIVPDRPGLGIELDKDVVSAHPLGPHPAADGIDPVWGMRTVRQRRTNHTTGEKDSMPKRKKLFLTGASGLVGTALRVHLRERYDFRLLVHSTTPDGVGADDEVVRSDVTNFAAMLEATAGIDVIVHLALARKSRMPEAQRAQLTFDVDMRGTYNLFEAARINGISTVIYASTNHVTGINERCGIRSHPDMPVRPDSIYGAGKAFGEALGRCYVDRHGLRVFCLRIANFNGRDEPGRYFEPGESRWLSPRDLAQLTWRCIEAEHLNWGIFYGVSGGAEKKWDLANAQELLGYEPQDDGSALEYRSKYSTF